MSDNIKIPFAIRKRDKKLVHISDNSIISGLACGCICPSCERPLQANKGQKNAHYFSHDPSLDTIACENAFETSIHLMSKQIFADHAYTIFGETIVEAKRDDNFGNNHSKKKKVFDKHTKNFTLVQLEQRIENIRPDIIAYTNNIPMLIEIAVTHFCDQSKLEKIKNLDIDAVEIDLSSISYSISKDELTELILNKFENKKWLYNKQITLAKNQLEKELLDEVDLINRSSAHKISKTPKTKSIILSAKKTTKAPSEQIKTIFDPRWFICESCRHHFKKSLANAPYTLVSIECPECGFPVSTASRA